MTDFQSTQSYVGEQDYLYPASKPFHEDYLTLSNTLPGEAPAAEKPQHEMYYAEYGKPDGEPVFFIHGGPGGGCRPDYTRFFDPTRYRIILIDQRGCGKSRPNVATDGPEAGLAFNTTQHLVEDIDRLRRHLGFEKIHVFGGSWGSTLSLAYAIAHPDHVQDLILRGIFLGSKADLDYMYQGNAATYHLDPKEITAPGTYLVYPEARKEFVEVIPVEKRGDMMAAYKAIFDKVPVTEEEKAYRLRAVRAWSVWEASISYLTPNHEAMESFGEENFALSFAQIEAHYFMNNLFMPPNYLLDNVGRITDIPIHIVHGRHDHVCPLMQAEQLVDALISHGVEPASYIKTTAGHSQLERETYLALSKIMGELPPMPGYSPQVAAAPTIDKTDRLEN